MVMRRPIPSSFASWRSGRERSHVFDDLCLLSGDEQYLQRKDACARCVGLEQVIEAEMKDKVETSLAPLKTEKQTLKNSSVSPRSTSAPKQTREHRHPACVQFLPVRVFHWLSLPSHSGRNAFEGPMPGVC